MTPTLATAPCRDRGCTACLLHEQCRTRCIPTRRRESLLWPTKEVAGSHPPCNGRALFVIGEAPGYNEDREGQGWVGKAGKLLGRVYLDYFKFGSLTDVYLSNAVRCHPLGNSTPNITQLKACQGFYLADIIYLQHFYEEVVVLCVGSPAVKSVLGCTLTKSFTRQGEKTDFRALTTSKTPKPLLRLGEVVGPYLDNPTAPPFPSPCVVFSTYHPAALLRDKNRGLPVRDHLSLLRDYLDGNLTHSIDPATLEIQMAPQPPDYPITRLSLDIETYGILKGQNQTQFHPLKSVLYDKVKRKDLCVTTGLSWLDTSGSLDHAVFILEKESHRRRLWSWLRKIRRDPGFECLLGQNIGFDIQYLRYAYPECKTWLDYPLPLRDLKITNYLSNETRPEKSLKALAPLLRVTSYGRGSGNDSLTSKQSSFRQYLNAETPELHQYNCQDTAATLLCQEKLEKAIYDLYGKDTAKLSAECLDWYSNLLWLVIWMEEAGICMDEPRLQDLLVHYQHRLGRLEAGIKDRWDIPLRGKGSEKAKREIMNQAVDETRYFNTCVPKLEVTKARKAISFCAENRHTLLDVLPPDCTSAWKLRAIERVHDTAGILDRYLYPLLVGRGLKHDDPSTRLIKGTCYPRWYPVPSEWEDGTGGGTKQARIVAKGPACQTFPPKIKSCIVGSRPGGYLIWFDYSQIELRMAALLSGDEWMMSEYSKPNCDFHLATAARLVGQQDALQYRQVGKTLNFLVIYLGGAHQFQSTLMRDEGIHRSLAQCEADIAAFWQHARGLRKWQNRTFEFVCQYGFFELPIIGQSRLYLGSRRDVQESLKEIVNMPIQATAANVMLDAQFQLWAEFKRRRIRATIPINVYDAAAIDCPPRELRAVREAIDRVLPNPPYYRRLCKILGRSLPLKYDVKVIEVPTT